MRSSSSIPRLEIVVVGSRSYRVHPSSLSGLESIDDRQYQVYREEEEADYYENNPDDDDEPVTCKPKQKRGITTID